MDSQNEQTSGWNNIFAFGLTTIKMTGTISSLWQNSLITCGETRQTKTTPYQMLMGYNPVADWKPINTTVPALISHIE